MGPNIKKIKIIQSALRNVTVFNTTTKNRKPPHSPWASAQGEWGEVSFGNVNLQIRALGGWRDRGNCTQAPSGLNRAIHRPRFSWLSICGSSLPTAHWPLPTGHYPLARWAGNIRPPPIVSAGMRRSSGSRSSDRRRSRIRDCSSRCSRVPSMP